MAETDKPEISSKGSSDPKENTRSRIAMIYVCAFFIVLSGPLGFIVGYYFKASKE